MANDDVIQIQRDLAAHYRALEIAKQQRLKKDIRGQIAKAGHYNPENDPVYEYVEYPKFVRDDAGKELGIAHNADEELAILGKKLAAAKAVTVNVAEIQKPDAAPAKRKYVRKDKPAPLPAALE